jgi:hypothetical protein
MENPKPSTKPVKVFRFRGISASIFANTAKTADREVSYYKVSLQRTYKDGDKFQTTHSFGRDDLPIAALLLKKAWTFILESEDEERRTAASEEN